MKNRGLIYTIILCLLVCASGLFAIRYIVVNRKYPQAIMEEYRLGEVFQYGGCDVCVQDYVILNKEEAVEIGYDLKDDVNYRILKCTMKVTNHTDTEKRPEMYYVEAESSVWHNGVDLEVIQNADVEPTSMNPVLKSGETATVTMAFVMYEFQFSDSNWKRIAKDDLFLVFSLYPVKQYVILQEKNS